MMQKQLKLDFEKADANGNGYLSMQELKDFLIKQSNQQKKISQIERIELEARFDNIVRTLFLNMDGDND